MAFGGNPVIVLFLDIMLDKNRQGLNKSDHLTMNYLDHGIVEFTIYELLAVSHVHLPRTNRLKHILASTTH